MYSTIYISYICIFLFMYTYTYRSIKVKNKISRDRNTYIMQNTDFIRCIMTTMALALPAPWCEAFRKAFCNAIRNAFRNAFGNLATLRWCAMVFVNVLAPLKI